MLGAYRSPCMHPCSVPQAPEWTAWAITSCHLGLSLVLALMAYGVFLGQYICVVCVCVVYHTQDSCEAASSPPPHVGSRNRTSVIWLTQQVSLPPPSSHLTGPLFSDVRLGLHSISKPELNL